MTKNEHTLNVLVAFLLQGLDFCDHGPQNQS